MTNTLYDRKIVVKAQEHLNGNDKYDVDDDE